MNEIYEDPTEVARAVRAARERRDRRKREEAAEPGLEHFFTTWDSITADLVSQFVDCLDSATGEQDLQKFLELNPSLLVQPLGGGHGRWVLPQKRLGSEYVTDFVIGEKSSIGFEWTAVELESPLASLFTKKGDPSARLTHGLRQITDWRTWLARNRDYASRPRDRNGLGLVDIDPSPPAWLIIGRRHSSDPATAERRRQMSNDLRVRIHSFDWLVERAEARVEELSRT